MLGAWCLVFGVCSMLGVRCLCLVFGVRCLVFGALVLECLVFSVCPVLGVRCSVLGAWCSVLASWCLVFGGIYLWLLVSPSFEVSNPLPRPIARRLTHAERAKTPPQDSHTDGMHSLAHCRNSHLPRRLSCGSRRFLLAHLTTVECGAVRFLPSRGTWNSRSSSLILGGQAGDGVC